MFLMRVGSRSWWQAVPVVRRRRRLRCWLGLPMRSLLDPVVRESLSALESLSFDRERGVWRVPDWGQEGGVWAPSFVDAVRRCGLVRSLWWWEVPVSLQESCGCWAISMRESPVESVDAEFVEWVGMMTGGELADLSAECPVSSEVGREVGVLCRQERRRREGWRR